MPGSAQAVKLQDGVVAVLGCYAQEVAGKAGRALVQLLPAARVRLKGELVVSPVDAADGLPVALLTLKDEVGHAVVTLPPGPELRVKQVPDVSNLVPHLCSSVARGSSHSRQLTRPPDSTPSKNATTSSMETGR